jgi:hypothetical protein
MNFYNSEHDIDSLLNFNNLNLNLQNHNYHYICYVYWNQYKNKYLLSVNNRFDHSKEIKIDVDLKFNGRKLYYGKIEYLEGLDSVVYVSNNKRKVCEYIINEFGIDIVENIIYYVTGDIYKCKFNCNMNTKEDIINCMMIHNTNEYEILELEVFY